MPTLNIEGVGNVNIPDDATREQAMAILRQAVEAAKPKPKTSPLQQVGAFFSGIPAGIIQGAAAIPEGIGGVLGNETLKDTGKWLRENEVSKYFTDVPEQFQGGYGRKAGEIAGNLATMIGPGAGARAAGAAPMAVRGLAALSGMAQGSSEQVQEAARNRSEGLAVTPEQETSAARWGSTTGLLDLIPFERITRVGMSGVKALAKEGAWDFVKGVTKTAGIEGGTEALQQGAQNLIEQQAYNPQQALGEGVPESFVAGSIAGGTLDGLIQGIGRKIAKNVDGRVQRERQKAPDINPDAEAAVGVSSDEQGNPYVRYVPEAGPVVAPPETNLQKLAREADEAKTADKLKKRGMLPDQIAELTFGKKFDEIPKQNQAQIQTMIAAKRKQKVSDNDILVQYGGTPEVRAPVAEAPVAPPQEVVAPPDAEAPATPLSPAIPPATRVEPKLAPVIPETGVQNEPELDAQQRLSREMFRKNANELTLEQATEVATRQAEGYGTAVKPQEVADIQEFADLPFTRDQYRAGLQAGKNAARSDLMVAPEFIAKKVGVELPVAKQILNHMVTRGEAKPNGKKFMVDPTAPGPMYSVKPKLSYVGQQAFDQDPANAPRIAQSRTAATEMAKSGKTDAEIRLATGWFKNPYDKQWRYEVGDQDAKMTQSFRDLEESKLFSKQNEIPLDQALDHPELFAAYPELKNIKVIKRAGLFDFGKGLQGSFNSESNTINITPYSKDPESTLIHEVQHWIQTKEGFASGGNEQSAVKAASPKVIEKALAKVVEKKTADLESLANEVSTLRSSLDVASRYPNDFQELSVLDQEKDRLWDEYMNNQTDENKSKWLDAGKTSTQKFVDVKDKFQADSKLDRNAAWNITWAARSVSPDKVAKAEQRFVEAQNEIANIRSGDEKAVSNALKSEAFDMYRNIAGEVEARDVQARKGMSQQQRTDTAPMTSENVSIEDAIVILGGDKSALQQQITQQNTKPDTVESLRTELESGTTPALAKAVHAEMVARGIDDIIATRLVDKLADGKGDAKYLKNIVTLAMDGKDTAAILAKMNHESVHAMRDMGLFSDTEWRILQAALDPNIILNDEERKLYGEYYGNNQSMIQEEAIARGMEKYMSGSLNLAKVPGSIIQSKLSTLSKIGDVFRSNKLNTAEQVASAFRSGEIGRRPTNDNVKIANDKAGVNTRGQEAQKGTTDSEATEFSEVDAEGWAIEPEEAVAEKAKLSVKQEDAGKRIFSDPDNDSKLGKGVKELMAPTPPGELGGWGLSMAIQVKDMRAGVEKLTQQAGDITDASRNAIESFRRFDLADSIAAAELKYGPADLIGGQYAATDTGGLIPIMERARAAGKFDKLMNYLAATGAMQTDPNAPEKILGGGATRQDVNQFLSFGSDPAVKGFADEFAKYNYGKIQGLYKSGVITPETRDKWGANAHLAMYRAQEDLSNGILAQSGGSSLASNPKIHQRKGSDKMIGDPITNIVSNNSMLTKLATLNLTKQRVVRDGMRQGFVRQAPKGVTKNVVTVYYEGKPRKFEVTDDLLYESMVAVRKPIENFWKLVAMPGNWLRESVTLAPPFMINNMIRDSTQVWAHGYTNTPILSAAKGFYDALTQSVSFRELERQGVIGNSVRGEGAAQTAKNVAYIVDPSLESALGRAKGMLERFSQASEAANRIVIYENVLKRTGGDKVQAASEAREILNFNRKGADATVQLMSAIVPFSNARLQGLDVLYRNLRDGRAPNKEMKGQLIRRATTLAALSTAYAFLMAGDDAYESATDEERSDNWFIKNPSGGPSFRVPIPFELGYVVKAMPEHLVRLYQGSEDGAAFVRSMARFIVSTLAFSPVPQAIKPFLEVKTNYDLFRQREIEPARLQRVEKMQRVDENTTEIARQIASYSGGRLSPLQADHLLSAYAGTTGMYVASLLDSLITDGKSMDWEYRKTNKLPIVGKLFQSKDGQGPLVDYYRIRDIADIAANSLKHADNPSETMKADAAFEKQTRSIDKLISELTKKERETRAALKLGTMTSKDAAERLDDLAAHKTSLARTVIALRKEK